MTGNEMIYEHGGRRVDAPGARHVIVFGINPGDKGPDSPSANKWLSRCDAVTEGYSDTFGLAELIQTSTADTAVLAAQGDIDTMIREGAEENLRLIRDHRPKVVIQCGLSVWPTVASAYRLGPSSDLVRRPAARGWLLRRSAMQDETPWITVRHLTGRCGFDLHDLAAANAYVSEVLQTI